MTAWWLLTLKHDLFHTWVTSTYDIAINSILLFLLFLGVLENFKSSNRGYGGGSGGGGMRLWWRVGGYWVGGGSGDGGYEGTRGGGGGYEGRDGGYGGGGVVFFNNKPK